MLRALGARSFVASSIPICATYRARALRCFAGASARVLFSRLTTYSKRRTNNAGCLCQLEEGKRMRIREFTASIMVLSLVGCSAAGPEASEATDTESLALGKLCGGPSNLSCPRVNIAPHSVQRAGIARALAPSALVRPSLRSARTCLLPCVAATIKPIPTAASPPQPALPSSTRGPARRSHLVAEASLGCHAPGSASVSMIHRTPVIRNTAAQTVAASAPAFRARLAAWERTSMQIRRCVLASPPREAAPRARPARSAR
jgi:hypothetical protein